MCIPTRLCIQHEKEIITNPNTNMKEKSNDKGL